MPETNSPAKPFNPADIFFNVANLIKKNLLAQRIRDVFNCASEFTKQKLFILKEDLYIKFDKIERLIKGMDQCYNSYMKDRISELLDAAIKDTQYFRKAVTLKFTDIRSRVISIVMGMEKIVQQLQFYNNCAHKHDKSFTITDQIVN